MRKKGPRERAFTQLGSREGARAAKPGRGVLGLYWKNTK